MSFLQKVVLITDGSDNIGATTAELFAKEGASIAIVGTNEAKLNAIAKACQKLGAQHALVIKADVSKNEEADAIVKGTVDKFGHLDVLVNNAGIFKDAGIFADNFLESYDEVMNANVRSAVHITFYAAPHLIKSKGNIINVSSMSEINATRRQQLVYGTAKAAMNDFTKSASMELAPHGVRINTISSGLKNSQQPVSEPNEIAKMIFYIASNKGNYITGSNLWRKLHLINNN